RRRHTIFSRDWSSDVCSSDLSPTYTVEQIRNIVGNIFFVGIDVNTTTHPLATEFLDLFTVKIDGLEEFRYEGPTQLVNSNNGNRSEERRVGKECRCRLAAHTS